MKKVIAILLVAVMVLSFIACAGGGDIVGTWEGEYDQLTFNSDGTGRWAERGSSSGSFGRGDAFTYKVSGSKLTIYPDEDTFTYSVSGDKLTLSYGGESFSLYKK